MAGETRANPPGYGEFAPYFTADLDVKPNFNFSSVAGRWIVLQFLVTLDAPLAKAGHQEILDANDLFDDEGACYYGVLTNSNAFENGPLSVLPGRRYFQDYDQVVSRLYGQKVDAGFKPMTLLLDRSLRVVACEPLRETRKIIDLLRKLLAEEAPTLASRSAPVLTVPRIFEPEFCQTLIDYYDRQGGEPSGFMRQIGDKTVGVYDTKFKRRKDATIFDEDLRQAAVRRIHRRLIPAIQQAYNWEATRIERYIVACYDSEEKGFFRAHRDNTTPGTAHRKFAVSINLNADFEGGELRFPEFGPRTYRPPLGGATVFGCSLLHEATPVTSGTRYAFLPFLYDEESKVIREQNAQSVVPLKLEDIT